MHKDRIKIATALGYYARATDPEAASLSAAIQAHALAEYRNDIDCQIAFRKGWQKAEEHAEASGPEAEELRELGKEVRRLIKEVYEMRGDLNYMLTKPAKYPTPPGGGGSGSGSDLMIAIDADGMGGFVINEIGPGGGGGGGGGGDGVVKVGGWPVSPFILGGGDPAEGAAPHYYLRRTDTGQLHCQDGKPVVYPSIPAAQKARDDLYVRMGIHCEPTELGKLNIGVNQRQNSPRVDINERARELRRRIAKLPE